MKTNLYFYIFICLLYNQSVYAQIFGGQIKTNPYTPCPITIVLEVVSPETGRIWMDRNLGASQVATSLTDVQAYGDYFQWGRSCDGHQKRYSSVISGPLNTDNPGKSFVNGGLTDWRTPRKDALWQGISGINNPCPTDFRIPTKDEWIAENVWNSQQAAFDSFLKLTNAGYKRESGGLSYVGGRGYYHSSTTESIRIRYLNLVGNFSTYQPINLGGRGRAYSVRCIKKLPGE